MNEGAPKAVAARSRRASPPLRGDVQALLALLAFDEASAGLKDGGADLAVRRGAIASRIPREALDVYDSALRRGLLPAAVPTRGRVCWGCFHGLSAPVAAPFLHEEVFLCCPHCERLLFNPSWTERK
jgi:predicted  nucleic acid-binding Zn-ribbon protein